MRLAIQEALLPGTNTVERFQNAQALGMMGVEVSDEQLDQRIKDIREAVNVTGLEISAVNSGYSRLLHPEFKERERAIVKIREAMANALDIGAKGVVFIPNYSTSATLPDLHPYKSAAELAGELLITQLRATLGDLAYALGAELYMSVVGQDTAYLINRLEQADRVLKANKYHPHLKVCTTICDLMREEDDPLGTLRQHSELVRYVHLADTGHGLPGTGKVDFKAVLATLKEKGYEGWLTIGCYGMDGSGDEHISTLQQSVAFIKDLL